MRCAISSPYWSMETSLIDEKYVSAPYQMSTGSHFFHCRSCRDIAQGWLGAAREASRATVPPSILLFIEPVSCDAARLPPLLQSYGSRPRAGRSRPWVAHAVQDHAMIRAKVRL